MTPPISQRRLAARNACRIAAILSMAMLVVSVAPHLRDGGPYVDAASAGPVVVVGATGSPAAGQPLAEGGSATAFTLQLPLGAACSGDSASSDYRVQSYMVPSSVDPGTLTFNFLGPVPTGTGANYRQPLYNAASGAGYVNQTTAVADTAGGPGRVPFPLPGFSFASTRFAADIIPEGTYNVGIACTRAAGSVLDKYWNTQLTFVKDDIDEPSGLTWTIVEEGPTDSTPTTEEPTETTEEPTETTDETVPSTDPPTDGSASVTPSSPTPGGAYSVTFSNCSSGETITFSQPESTPASVTATCSTSSALESGFRRPTQASNGSATGTYTAAPSTPGTYTVTMRGTVSAERTVTFEVSASATVTATTTPSGGNPTSGLLVTGSLPTVGSSPAAIIIWAILLLVFGRMAILLGRTPRVLSDSE